MKLSKENGKQLSIEDGFALLGAEPVDGLEKVGINPIAAKVLATQVAQRMTANRGRPTDKSWDIQRKVPMKQATWDECQSKAESCKAYGRKVAAGQVAAMAIEVGLQNLDLGPREVSSSRVVELYSQVSQARREEAAPVVEAICASGGLW